MKQNYAQKITHYIAITVIGLVFGAGIQAVVYAWSGPTQAPPIGNVSGPITTGSTQFKTGALGINTNANPNTGFGLSVGENVSVGGKIYSASTIVTDSGSTVVTKDYVDSTRLVCRIITVGGATNGTGPYAVCDADEVVTGGGCSVATNGNVTACSPHPNVLGDGRQGFIGSGESSDGIVRQAAICCKK
jgi:hypothetical protein